MMKVLLRENLQDDEPIIEAWMADRIVPPEVIHWRDRLFLYRGQSPEKDAIYSPPGTTVSINWYPEAGPYPFKE